jgi:transposase
VFLTPAQLAMLMEGIDWRQPKRVTDIPDHVVALFILVVAE